MSLSEKIKQKRRAKVIAKKKEAVKNVGIGVATGVVAGAVGGILLAPKSGKEIREDIKEVSVRVNDKVGAKVKDTCKFIGDKVEIKKEKLGKIRENLKDGKNAKKEIANREVQEDTTVEVEE